MNYKKALESIVKKRKERIALSMDAYNFALRNDERLYAIEVEIRGHILASVNGESKDEQALKSLEDKKKKLLMELGLTDKLLNPPPLCKKCGDTGLVKGKFCDCVKRQAILDDEAIGLPTKRFCDSDPKIEEASGLKELYEHMRAFVKKFPLTNTKNIVLLGSTGTGKTHLASIVAGEILDRGFSVVFLTAFGALQKMLAFHKSFDEDRDDNLRPLLEADLLIIDDLGTESMLKNVTLEYLYIVINERTLRGRHTMITSNLSMTEMASRYSEKLVSRLFDKNICLSRVLNGKDLRKEAF